MQTQVGIIGGGPSGGRGRPADPDAVLAGLPSAHGWSLAAWTDSAKQRGGGLLRRPSQVVFRFWSST